MLNWRHASGEYAVRWSVGIEEFWRAARKAGLPGGTVVRAEATGEDDLG
jgi:hypothetical protein